MVVPPSRAWPVLSLVVVALAGCGTAPPVETDVETVGTTSFASTVVCGAPANGAVQGVDVSHYQGAFDWGGAKSRGIVFGYASVGDGIGFTDPEFTTNWANMKAAGVLRGAYQFFEPGEDPVAQANLMVQAVGQLGQGDLPCMVDVETTGGQSGATIAAHVRTWLSVVQQGTGKAPIVYTGPYFWDGSVGDTGFGATPLWIADYGPSCPAVPNGWSSWLIWQYGDTGGTLDQDVFNGSLADLQKLAGVSACQPHCQDATTIVASDCSTGNCGVFGASCVDDSLGARCVFNECPAQGTKEICVTGKIIGACTNGALAQGDCSVYGATCVDDSLGARCVFYECPAQGTKSFCPGDAGTIATCDNGAYSTGDCSVYGARCVDDSLGGRCVFGGCPAKGTATICLNGKTLGTCDNGALSSGDCSAFGASCVADSLPARCVFYKCPADGDKTVCVDGNTLGNCHNGAVSFQNCAASGVQCVTAGGDAYCSGPLAAVAVTVTSKEKPAKSSLADYEACTGSTVTATFDVKNVGTLAWSDENDLAPADTGKAVRLDTSDGTKHSMTDPFNGQTSLSVNASSNATVSPTGSTCTTSGCDQTVFTVTGKAPAKPGVYTTTWQLHDEGRAWFGPVLALRFDVFDCGLDGGATSSDAGAARDGSVTRPKDGGHDASGDAAAATGSAGGCSCHVGPARTSPSHGELGLLVAAAALASRRRRTAAKRAR